MDIQVWLIVLTRAVAGVLAANGKNQQAAYLNDALAAVKAGKNVDHIMRQHAERWEQNGEPSFDEIAQDRQRIQELMGS
jgi:hypothetical protein